MSDQKPKDRCLLRYPVTVNGQEYARLEMRRPKVDDDLNARRAGRTDAEAEVALFAILCGVPEAVIRGLDHASDYQRLSEDYQGFFA